MKKDRIVFTAIWASYMMIMTGLFLNGLVMRGII
jgi:hypothetical protein